MIFGFLKKKKKPKLPSYYAVVDFSDEAKELCVGGKHNLRIKYYERGRFIDEEIYSDSRYMQLIKDKIPVVWRAKFDIPIECAEQIRRFVLWGKIKLGESE